MSDHERRHGLHHYHNLGADPTSRERELQRIYAEWAARYDHDNDDDLGTVSQPLSVQYLQRFVRTDAQILDVGCGTGLVGAALTQAGYQYVDGSDLSPEMLQHCQGRGYRQLTVDNLSSGLALPDAHYDAAICVGVFTHGHVPPTGINHLLRIVKPAGHIVFTVNEGVYQAQGFDQHIEQLVQAGTVQIKCAEKNAYMIKKNVDAWYFVLKMLHSNTKI